MELKIGRHAPDFTLPSTGGKTFHLSENLRDGKLVLYFYPKDFTPGCTAEACGFRDEFSELAKSEIRVYGISTDTIESHERFKNEHRLPFDLLSDPGGEVSRVYGVYNRLFKIANRVSFILDRDGKILKIIKNFFIAKAHINGVKSTEKI